MKLIPKSKRFWLALAMLLGLAVATAVLWPKPPRQIITLANGDQYEFAGATYGTNIVPPSLLCHLVERLPASLHKLAEKYLGNRITWQALSPADGPPPFTRPVLAVWFRQVHVNSLHRSLGYDALPDVWLADQNNLTINEAPPGVAIFGIDRSRGWFSRAFTVIPKRSPIIHALLWDGANGTKRFSFRNPAFGNYPQWQSTNLLSSSFDFPDLHGRVGNWDIKRSINESADYSTFAIFNIDQTNTAWAVTDAELSDATGNVIHSTVATWSSPLPPSEGRPLSLRTFYHPPWPGESAWRLKIQFTNKSTRVGHSADLYLKPSH